MNPSAYDYDITIIGSGPAGYVAAIRAAQLGAKTAVIEKEATVGGTCLNVGCIPTKALLASVGVLDHATSGASFGVKVSGIEIDLPTMMARKQKIVKQLTSGVEGLFRKNKVTLIRGSARLEDSETVVVDSETGSQKIRSKFILLATGSVPATLPMPGFEPGSNLWNSTDALEFTSIPKSMLIVGAGAIGLEAGYMFSRMGADVTIVEVMPQILPAADAEIAKLLQKFLEAAGMKFMLGAKVTGAQDTPTGKKVSVLDNGKELTFDVEKLMVAVGRKAVINGIGLENAGIAHDGRKVLVNKHMQTNVPNIYAAGDTIGEPMLAHVGWTEGTVAVEHMMGMPSAMDYRAFPACVYTTPECSSVGLTEAQARERFKDVRVGKFTFNHNGKAMGIGETEGLVKVIIDGRYGEVLGVHMVGPHVTDMIAEAVVVMHNELTVDELIASIHPHPTLSEVVFEAALDSVGRALHK